MKLISALGILISILFSSTALAGQAVSTVNGKLSSQYGDMDSYRGKNISGSIAAPLGENFGLQADGLYTHVSGRDFYGLGAQLFWRDSQIGLIGVSAAGIHENDTDSYMYNIMGEYYLDLFTLGLTGGMAQIKYDIGPVPFISTDETEPYARGAIGFYPLDDLLIEASYTFAFDNHLYQCVLEYQTPVSGLCIFADFATGSRSYDHNLFGIRYYFGKTKSLKRRHREDDPQNIVNNVINNIGTYGAEYNKEAKEYNRKAREYNERLKTDPTITPDIYNQLVLPTYDDDSYGIIIYYLPPPELD